MAIVLKTDSEISEMRRAGALTYKLLDLAESMVKPGVSTLEINDLVHKETLASGAKSAPLNYRGFPKSVCTSVNNVVCHGIPSSSQILKEGDLINVDISPILGKYHGDSSRTFLVGECSAKAKNLAACAKKCLDIGISVVEVGSRVGDIGHAIQTYAEAQGYSVVREFVGHGIGTNFHEDPQIPHYGKPGTGTVLKPGMVFTIEPMINAGGWRCKILDDGWTAVTADGSLSAQFEHTLAIRSDGSVEILTRP